MKVRSIAGAGLLGIALVVLAGPSAAVQQNEPEPVIPGRQRGDVVTPLPVDDPHPFPSHRVWQNGRCHTVTPVVRHELVTEAGAATPIETWTINLSPGLEPIDPTKRQVPRPGECE